LETSSPAGVAEIRRQNDELAAHGKPPLIDLLTVQSILFVMRSLPPPPPPSTMPGPTQWPYSSRPGGGWEGSYQVGTRVRTVQTGSVVYQVAEPFSRRIQTVCMQHNWESIQTTSSKSIQDTACHDCVTTLGCPTNTPVLTTRRTPGRETNDWSLMSFEQDLPQLSTAEWLMLGWTKPEWIKALNFAVGSPSTST
jgi:hypothetical protein